MTQGEGLYAGIDPSKSSTGFAILNAARELIDYGVIRPDKELSFEEQLHYHYIELDKLFSRYNIRQVVMEDQFFQNNAETLKQLARVSAMTMLVCQQKGIPMITNMPNAWRKTFHGAGSKWNKRDTFAKVKEMYSLNDFKYTKHNDITDAIGIGNACVDYSFINNL